VALCSQDAAERLLLEGPDSFEQMEELFNTVLDQEMRKVHHSCPHRSAPQNRALTAPTPSSTRGLFTRGCVVLRQIHNFFTAQEAMLKSELKAIRAELEGFEPCSPNSVELIKTRYSRVPWLSLIRAWTGPHIPA
jgi:hypothetical protein